MVLGDDRTVCGALPSGLFSPCFGIVSVTAPAAVGPPCFKAKPFPASSVAAAAGLGGMSFAGAGIDGRAGDAGRGRATAWLRVS